MKTFKQYLTEEMDKKRSEIFLRSGKKTSKKF